MHTFDYQPTTRVVFGENCIEQIGDLVLELGGSRPLLVSDPGIVQAGHTERGLDSLRKAGLDVHLFTGVEENPTTRHVDAGVEFARQCGIDLIVSIGGGSSMDCAKGINFLLTNGGKMADYWGVGKATKPMLPLIAVPTTAGTGSEAQSFALIADEHTHLKMACGDKKAACKVAVLDPTVTVTQPEAVTAVTGMDAISHAVETYVTRQRSPVSRLFSAEAWRLLESNLEKTLESPTDLRARGNMLFGANLAGAAIENSMLGATHACANPVTARYGITHGTAISVLLPHVIRFNGTVVGDLYQELADVAGLKSADGTEALAMRVESLSKSCGLPGSLRELGVSEEHLPELAREASQQWTGSFNPRPVTEEDFAGLYEGAF